MELVKVTIDLEMSFPAILGLFLFLMVSALTAMGRDLDYYLPGGTSYDPAVTTPEAFLGYEIGDWHIRHDQLVAYLERLSEESPRIHFQRIGRSHELRPLVLVTVTSAENHSRLEEIPTQHLQLGDPAMQGHPDETWPVVVYMGYSVHGDESSGANGVPVLAYHLAAGQGAAVESLLARTVILIDPCLNPDGFSRFAQWANGHRGRQPVGDAEHREHHAAWPGGRTKHYWFDLNRDWLLAQHPESQARLAHFHRWRPNVHTDFHEMGSESTYFFQPGVPERKHPLTPTENVALTEAFAREHAAALDQIRSLYFTEERFDDFYYGKGSTYPDIHGGVGILFEQASARGHRRESPHGEFDFAFTIRNQLRTSLSTLAAATEQAERLLRYQQQFYRDALALAEADPVKAYVFGETRDQTRLEELLVLLHRHQIRVHQLGREVSIGGRSFRPGTSHVVPLDQPQYRLIKALFETRTTFEDDVFYDVSTWTMPLAFGIPYGERREVAEGEIGERWTAKAASATPRMTIGEAYAYAIEWDDYLAPAVLYQLQKASVRVAAATVPLRLTTVAQGERDFARGTLVIPAARQQLEAAELSEVLASAVQSTPIEVHLIKGGLTADGVDLGSAKIVPLKPVAPALIVGSGVSHYEAGEVWHLLDHRMGMTLPLLELEDLGDLDLERYSHLILVDGNYGALGESEISLLKTWVKRGGILMAQKRAARWAAAKELAKVSFVTREDEKKPGGNEEGEEKKEEDAHEHEHEHEEVEALPYGDYHAIEDAKRTSGAIFRGRLDLSHPLAFGYREASIPVFRNSNLVMRPSENPYATPLRYASEDPVLMSGYVFPENLKRFRGRAGMVAEKVGRGAVILAVDNPNFRAFWYGTNRLFLNGLFFGQLLEGTSPKSHDDASAAQDHHH